MDGQHVTAQTLESKPSLSASFKLKHLLISDTEAKVASLKHPEGAADNAHIVEMDVPYPVSYTHLTLPTKRIV